MAPRRMPRLLHDNSRSLNIFLRVIKLLDSSFLCPQTGEPLILKGDHLCSSKVQYPNVDGIPWIYRDPSGALNHWRKKLTDVVLYSQQVHERAEESLQMGDLLSSTRTRLELLKQGHQQNIETLSALLPSSLAPATDNDLISVDRVPKQQSALAYHGTLFRDWVWGKSQIQHYADLLAPALKGRRRVAFPGAGACGLPVEIHNRIQPDLSLAIDINPILLLAAKKMLSGETLKLIEFPLIPTKSEYVFVEHTIRGQRPAPGFAMMFTDAQNLTAKDKNFDAVVTSWFFDIVPRDFRETARLMNAILATDGVWSNIGQLGFEKNDLAQVYGPDEVKQILTESGFEISLWDTPQIPYLQSPYSAVGRQDQVWLFAARKIKQAKRPPVFEYWPQWLNSLDQPIPLDDALRAFKVRAGIYASVLDHIDGQRSLNQVAALVARDFHMDSTQALAAVHSFFSNYFEGVVFREF